MNPAPVEWLEQPGDVVAAAAAELAAGNVVVFPTDTVYGLLAAPDSDAAYRRVYTIKGRSFGKPLALLVAPGSPLDLDARAAVAAAPAGGHAALAQFAAGTLTVVLAAASLPHLPAATAAIQPGAVGLRCPAHPQLQQLLAAAGGCAWATSVNLSGSTAAVTALEVSMWLAEVESRGAAAPSLAVLSSAEGSGRASDVLDLTADQPRRLR